MNEAIQILEEILEESRQYDGALIYISEYHWNALEMAIDALKRSKWIPCSERLPEVWDYVLCSQINGDVAEGQLLDDGYWHICYDQSHRRKTWVVAWQPLPERYKKEGGEE